MSSYCQLKGTSGSGKGTRVSQLLIYLDSITETKVFKYLDKHNVAIEIPEFKIVILGKIVKSNKSGLLSLTGLDMLQSGWEDADGNDFDMVSALILKYKDWNIIAEGYPCTLGTYFSPNNVLKMGFKNQMWCYYFYNTLEELQERVVGRSKKRIKGSCWDSNGAFKHEYEIQVTPQLNEMHKDTSITSTRLVSSIESYKSNFYKFGARYLKFIGREDLVLDFISFSENKNTLRHVTDTQDPNMFPDHLHGYDFTPPVPMSNDEYEKSLDTLHPSEPKSVWIGTLNSLEDIMKVTLSVDTYKKIREDFNLPQHWVLKRQLNKLIEDEQFSDLVDKYKSSIDKFLLLNP